jgi:hypothetical protein
LQWDYIFAPAYFPTVCMINVSILLLYRRIFETEWFKKVSLGFIIVNILWMIPGTVTEAMTCTPPSSYWESETPSCIHYGIFWTFIMTFEVFVEFCLMTLPVVEVRKLHLSTDRKISVSAIFLLGSWYVQVFSH